MLSTDSTSLYPAFLVLIMVELQFPKPLVRMHCILTFMGSTSWLVYVVTSNKGRQGTVALYIQCTKNTPSTILGSVKRTTSLQKTNLLVFSANNSSLSQITACPLLMYISNNVYSSVLQRRDIGMWSLLRAHFMGGTSHIEITTL